MRTILKCALLATTLGFAIPANAQDISGGIDLKSSYALNDFGYEAGPDPVVQGYIDIAIADTGCKAGTWGNKSLGRQIGNEIDLGAGCDFKIDDDTTVTVTGTRYLLLDAGVPDMTAITASVKRGRVDLNVGYYIWDRLPNGMAASVGYTTTVKGFDLRGSVHYAHGLGDPDIVFVGGKVSHGLTDNLSIGVQAYVPVVRSNGDPRKTQIVGAISFSF